MTATITPLSPLVGAQVTGISGAAFVDQKVVDQCQELLDKDSVVVYRGAFISDDDLVDFSALLGTIDVVPTGEHVRPEIQTITLDPTKTSPILAGYRRGNFLWHFDGSTGTIPQKTTMLSAIEIDDSGQGGTQFASGYAAYEALPQADKDLLADLKVEHSFAIAQARVDPDADEAERATWHGRPPRFHRLVWTRSDGRKSLLIGATAGRIVGWTQEASDELLNRLLAWVTRPEFVVQHDWQKGDLVIWDNTGMLHRAMPFKPTSPRLMHRTTLVGDPMPE